MIVVIDPNEKDLQDTARVLRRLYPAHDIETFTHPMLSVKFAANNPVRAIFLAAEMRGLEGGETAKLIRRFHGGVLVFFLADTERYRQDARAAGADGYLVKPLSDRTVSETCGSL